LDNNGIKWWEAEEKCNEEPHNLQYETNIIRMIKSRRIR
jgi:hypothetical protein